MKNIVLFSIVLFGLYAYSQDTLYLSDKYKKVDKTAAAFYKIMETDPADKKLHIENIYYLNGITKSKRIYRKYYSKKRQLVKSDVFYESGAHHLKSTYYKGKKDGKFISYHENGNLKRKDIYKKGKFIRGTCWDENNKEVPYYEFEIRPEFPGGTEALATYIKKNINTTIIPAQSKGLTIKASFVVATDGGIENILLKGDTDDITNNEVIRVMQNMPKWKPGQQEGKLVRVQFVLPVVIR
jgi:hypothetical protein